MERLRKSTIEVYVEISQIVLQEIWNSLRVRDDAFNQTFIVFDIHIADERTHRLLEHLDDLLFGLFIIVINQNMIAFSLLRTANNELF